MPEKLMRNFKTDRHPPLHGKWRKTRSCKDLENVGQVEELLLMTEQMQDELDQKDQTILELNKQLSESLTLNEKLNSENRVENIEALRTRLRQTEERLTSETDSRKRADAEVVAWKFKYEKAEQEKLYAQTHQKTVEVAIVMGILFTITGLLIVGIGYQVGKIYRKYCWDILSIIVAITSTAIVIYFGEWIKNAIPINLMVFLLLSHVIYIYFHANIYYHISMKGESI